MRLNRPEKMNALDRPMFEALVETGRALAADRALRAVVLSGEGRGFCAGLDFASFMAMAGESSDPGPTLLDRRTATARPTSRSTRRTCGPRCRCR